MTVILHDGLSADTRPGPQVGPVAPAAATNQLTTLDEGLGRLQALLVKNKGISLSALLPLIFRLKGKPFDIGPGHFMYEPMYRMGPEMPRRSILKTGRQTSKSTTNAAMQILLAACRPYTQIMTVTPRFEQVRKFSTNYVRPFLAESSIKSSLMIAGQDNSVLQRSLANGSNLFYGSVGGSADRLRGVPLDVVFPDECLATGTMVATPDGQTPIEQLAIGDLVLSFDETGNISVDMVQDKAYKGRRTTYRLELDDGTAIRCTENEKFFTSQGWKFLADIADLTGASDSPGHHAGGLKPIVPGQAVFQVPTPGAQPRTRSVRVRQLAQRAASVSEHERKSGQESWVREFHTPVGIELSSRLRTHPQAVYRGWEKAGKPRVARPHRPRWPSSVVHGRWKSNGRQRSQIAYRRVQLRREPVHRRLVCQPWADTQGSDVQGILLYRLSERGHQITAERGATAHHTKSSLQGDFDAPRRSAARYADAASPRAVRVSGLGSRRVRGGVGGTCQSSYGHTCALSLLDPQESAEGLAARKIVSVELAGVEDVWDITTTVNHTFFANGIAVHNCQDLDEAVIGVLMSGLDASDIKLERYAGTPKTNDNLIQQLWNKSSQAEWVIECQEPGCRYRNLCRADADLVNMMGDRTLVCAKCKKPVDSRNGYWYHSRPSLRASFTGYHVPQVIMPMHYASPVAWSSIMEKKRDQPKYILYNECLGESLDTGLKLLSESDLGAAGTAAFIRPDQFNNNDYVASCMGVDWGGKGREIGSDTKEFISNTAAALVARKADGRFVVPWLKIMPYEADHFAEAAMICQAAKDAHVDFIAHDFTGGGAINESILTAQGYPRSKIVPFTYNVTSPKRPIVYYEPPAARGVRASYTLDKTRSLLLLVSLIKSGTVELPPFDQHTLELGHLLALYEEMSETARGKALHLVKRLPGRPDDMAHAINFGVMAICHSTRNWPKELSNFVRPASEDDDDEPVWRTTDMTH